MLTAHRSGELPTLTSQRIGPGLIFERLWHETGCQAVLQDLLAGRRFEFAVERAVFLTVLHRLLPPGSDRAADKWKEDYLLDGAADLELHHLYRAMAWLGEAVAGGPAARLDPAGAALHQGPHRGGAVPAPPRPVQHLDMVFFDTTSIYFEGEGGDELGQYGHSKDHRPDLHQMVVGVVLDGDGRPHLL